jgi:phosphoribosylaminoimidazole (AIR) synthetase
MPDFYAEGEYDLSGFAVGKVKKDKLIDGKNIVKGDVLIGLPSSGVHSNGFSLARRYYTFHLFQICTQHWVYKLFSFSSCPSI